MVALRRVQAEFNSTPLVDAATTHLEAATLVADLLDDLKDLTPTKARVLRGWLDESYDFRVRVPTVL